MNSRHTSRIMRLLLLVLLVGAVIAISIRQTGAEPIAFVVIVTVIVVAILLRLSPRLDARMNRASEAGAINVPATRDPDGTRDAGRLLLTRQGVRWCRSRTDISESTLVRWEDIREIHLTKGPRGLIKSCRLIVDRDDGTMEFLATADSVLIEQAIRELRPLS